MLSPENWQEYEWRNVVKTTVGQVVAEPDWRIWRVTVSVQTGALGGSDCRVDFGGSFGAPSYSMQCPVGYTTTVEPKGMYPGIVTVFSGAEFTVNVELIRRATL